MLGPDDERVSRFEEDRRFNPIGRPETISETQK